MTKRTDIASMRPDAFFHIDEKVDNFAKISDVSSELIYGVNQEKNSPWVTVVIPTYNRKELFCQTLQSVLSQENVPYSWEIIVVDNTPLDESGNTPALSVIRKLAAKNVKLYHNRKNLGSGYNWNRGAELAQGEWVCFLHDDDVLCRDALQQIGRLLNTKRNSKRKLGYLSARKVEFQNKFGLRLSTEFPRQPQEVLTRFGVLICGHTGAGAPTCGTTILKEAYIKAGGINYDFGPSADAVLCYQIMRDYDVVTTDCVIGGYCWDENATLNKQTLLDFIRADDLLMAYAYQKNAKTKQWGRWFGAAISWRNIWRKNNTAIQCGVSITTEEFTAASRFPKPGFLKRNLYLAIYAGYRLWRKMTGY